MIRKDGRDNDKKEQDVASTYRCDCLVQIGSNTLAYPILTVYTDPWSSLIVKADIATIEMR
jgi:hypothetical protein